MAKKRNTKKPESSVDATSGADFYVDPQAYNYMQVFGPMEGQLQTLAQKAKQVGNKKVDLAATAATMDLNRPGQQPALYNLKDIDMLPINKNLQRTQDFINSLSEEQLQALAEQRGKTFKDKLRLVRDLDLNLSQIGPAIGAYQYGKDANLLEDGGSPDPTKFQQFLQGLIPSPMDVANSAVKGIGMIGSNLLANTPTYDVGADYKVSMNNGARIGKNFFTGMANNGIVGGIAQGISSLFTGKRDLEEQQAQLDDMRGARHANMRLNNLPTAETGGFIIYNGDSHSDPSNGIQIDKSGNQVAITGQHPVALTENKEVMWMHPDIGTPYVFSEKNGFAAPLRKTIKKFKLDQGDKSLARTDKLIDEAVQKQFNDTMIAQELYNQKSNVKMSGALPQAKCGGRVKQMATGGVPYGDPTKPLSSQDYFWVNEIGNPYDRVFPGYYLDGTPGTPAQPVQATTPTSTTTPTTPTTETPAREPINIGRMPGLFTIPTDIASPINPGLKDMNAYTTGDFQLPAEQYNPNLSPAGHILSGVGTIADYFAFKNKARPDAVSLGRVGPERVSYAQNRLMQSQEGEDAKRISATNARNYGLNAGQAMANISAANTGVNRAVGQSISQSFENENNTNAQLRMQANQINADLRAQERLYNSQMESAYNARLAEMNPIGNLSRLAASYFKDNAAYKTDWATRRMLAPNANITEPQDSTLLDKLLGLESPNINYSLEQPTNSEPFASLIRKNRERNASK